MSERAIDAEHPFTYVWSMGPDETRGPGALVSLRLEGPPAASLTVTA
jgi:hypothetical protein